MTPPAASWGNLATVPHAFTPNGPGAEVCVCGAVEGVAVHTPPADPPAPEVITRVDLYDRDTLGRILNPDTGVPFASLDDDNAALLASLCETYDLAGETRDAINLVLSRVQGNAIRRCRRALTARAAQREELAAERVAVAQRFLSEGGDVIAAEAEMRWAATLTEQASALRHLAL